MADAGSIARRISPFVTGALTSPHTRQLRRWLLDRLSPHKVPRKVLLLDALPRTASGKVIRRALAEAAASPDPPPNAPPPA